MRDVGNASFRFRVDTLVDFGRGLDMYVRPLGQEDYNQLQLVLLIVIMYSTTLPGLFVSFAVT